MGLCGNLALSEHQNVVPQVGWVTNFFGRISHATIIYHIDFCLPIIWRSQIVLWGATAAISSVCFRRGHPFLRWLFKSVCPTNFAGQAEHDRGQSSLWNFLMCRLNLRTLLEHPWTQHRTCLPRLPFPVPLSDITCFTASRRVKKCFPGQLEQRIRPSDIA